MIPPSSLVDGSIRRWISPNVRASFLTRPTQVAPRRALFPASTSKQNVFDPEPVLLSWRRDKTFSCVPRSASTRTDQADHYLTSAPVFVGSPDGRKADRGHPSSSVWPD